MSRDCLFKILPLIGCPPRLISIIKSFHDGMRRTVQYDSETSSEFEQGCVLAPTLFGIFFAMLFRHTFKGTTEEVLIRDMLFADDAALAAHPEGQVPSLMNRFYKACDLCSLTIRLKKTQAMCQGTAIPTAVSVKDHQLEVVNQFIQFHNHFLLRWKWTNVLAKQPLSSPN